MLGSMVIDEVKKLVLKADLNKDGKADVNEIADFLKGLGAKLAPLAAKFNAADLTALLTTANAALNNKFTPAEIATAVSVATEAAAALAKVSAILQALK